LQSSYYYIGHFARFVRPGARRVLCAATRHDTEAAAFMNTDGSSATVVMNRAEQPQRLALRIDGIRTMTELPPRSIATYVA
jgi:glucosylceramidase